MVPPISWDKMIWANEPVQLMSRVVDKLDLGKLMGYCIAVGNPSYHPQMMLKDLEYANLKVIQSSGLIEEACRPHIHFMWLSGGDTYDHNTIARFRYDRLGGGRCSRRSSPRW